MHFLWLLDGRSITSLMSGISPDLLVSLLVLGTAVFFLWRAKAASRLPGPAYHGPLLNTLQVFTNLPRLLDWMLENSLRFGGESGQGTWSFKVLLQPTYVVTHDPECLRHVLTNVDNYGKGPVWRTNFYYVLGDGIFSADHAAWYHQRKTAAHMFKVSNFKTSILRVLRDKTVELLDILHSRLEEAGQQGQDSVVVDMQELFFRFTLDTIGKIAFGKDLESLSGKNEDFMRAFDFAQMYCNDLFFLPGPAWLHIYFTPRGWAYQRHIKVLEDYGNRLIKDVVLEQQQKRMPAAAGGEDDSERRDETILSLFLEKSAGDEKKGDLLRPENLRELRDVIMNFQIAGRDTVAQALAWSVYLLSLHPDVQEKVHDEAVAVLGNSPVGEVTYEQINSLKYTHATVTEVLRLYPSVPKEGKWAFHDDVLPDGTKVSAGSWLMFSPYAMGRLASLWPDPLAFNPSRHMNGPKPSSFVFTSFQAGPRICLGQSLAYMQLQYVLSVLMLHFRLSLEDAKQPVVPIQTSATMPQAQGARVRLEPRDKSRVWERQ